MRFVIGKLSGFLSCSEFLSQLSFSQFLKHTIYWKIGLFVVNCMLAMLLIFKLAEHVARPIDQIDSTAVLVMCPRCMPKRCSLFGEKQDRTHANMVRRG